MTEFDFFWKKLMCSLGIGVPRGWEKDLWMDYLNRAYEETEPAREYERKLKERAKSIKKAGRKALKKQKIAKQPLHDTFSLAPGRYNGSYFSDSPKTARQQTKEENARALKEAISTVVTPIRSAFNQVAESVLNMCQKAADGICVAYQPTMLPPSITKKTR